MGSVFALEFLQSMAKTKPGGKEVSGLRPGEYPGDGAEVTEIARSPPAGGTRAEPDLLDQIDGSCLAEIIHKLRGLIDEFTIEIAAARRQLRGIAFPLRNLARFHPARVKQMRVKHRSHQLFE